MSEIYQPGRRHDIDVPQPSEAEKRLIKFLDQLEKESTSVEGPVKSTWDSNLSWFRGQQWPIRNRQPLFMANKIGEIGRRKSAKLTEMKPQVRVQSRRAGLQTTSSVLESTIEAGWDEYDMQMVLSDMALHLFVYGASFLDISYDPYADGGRGDIVPSIIDPRSVHIDPVVARAQDLNKAAYIWTEQFMSTYDVRRRWPGRGSLVAAGHPEGISENAVQRYTKKLFAAWRSGSKLVEEAIPRSLVKTYYFTDPELGPNGHLRYPNGRRIVRSGDVILEDGPNPYWDGGWPLVMVDGLPDPEHPWGISDVQGLRRLQEAVNRMGHMFVENSLLTGNTWVTYDEGSIESDTLQRLSNIGAILLGKQRGTDVRREPPPQMPPHMMGFIDTAIALMDQISGLSDTTISSQGRAEVRSDEQLEGLQQAAEVLLRATARRVEAGLERFGQKWISRIFQFYTRDRVLSYMGPTLEWQTFEFERTKLLNEIDAITEIEIKKKIKENTIDKSHELMILEGRQHAWKHFLYKITPGSSLASSRSARAALHMNLADRGYISRQHPLRDLGFSNPQEELEQAQREAMFLGGGGRPASGG